jgi:hypothetical protein
MSLFGSKAKGASRPLVAVVCSVPLIGEALTTTLDFAEVRSFSSRGGDIAGLLTWVRPDAVIVDSQDGAAEATAFAREQDVPLVYMSVRDHSLHLYRSGQWEQVSYGQGPTPEALRNVVAGSLFARGGPAR